MSKPQETQFDSNKHTPDLTEIEARRWVAAMETNSLIRPLSAEEKERDYKAMIEFHAPAMKAIEEADRIEREEKAEKKRIQDEKDERRRQKEERIREQQEISKSWKSLAEQQAADKAIRTANSIVAKLFSNATDLSIALQKVSAEEIPALAGLRPVLENLLKRI